MGKNKSKKTTDAVSHKVKEVISKKNYDDIVKFVPEAFDSMMNEAFDTTTKEGNVESSVFFEIAEKTLMSSHKYLLMAYRNMGIYQSELFGYIFRTNIHAAHIIRLTGDILEYVSPEAEGNAVGISYYDEGLREEVTLEPGDEPFTLEQSVRRFSSLVWDSGLRIHGLEDIITNAIRRFVARDVISAIRIDREDLDIIDITVQIDRKVPRRTFWDFVLRRKVTEADVCSPDVRVFINAYKS